MTTIGNLKPGAESLQRRAHDMRAELALADELIKIGSLQQAGDEAQKRLEALRAKYEPEERAAQERIEAAKREAAEIARVGKVNAAKLLDEAQKALDEGIRAAGEHVSKARAEAEELKARVNGEIDELRKRLNDLGARHVDVNSKIGKATDEHAALLDAISASKREHDQIRGAIKEALSRLGS